MLTVMEEVALLSAGEEKVKSSERSRYFILLDEEEEDEELMPNLGGDTCAALHFHLQRHCHATSLYNKRSERCRASSDMFDI